MIGAAEHAAQAAAVDLSRTTSHNLVFDSTSHDDPDDAADDALGAVHDQRRGAQLRHRLGHARARFRRLGSSSSSRRSARPGGTAVQATAVTTLNVHGPPRTSPSRGRRCRSRRKPAASAICTRRLSAAMPTRSASTSTARSASSPSSVGSEIPPASSRPSRQQRPVAAVDDSTERLRARPAIRPPASRAARSGQSIGKLTSGRPMCRSRRRRTRIRPARDSGLPDVRRRAPGIRSRTRSSPLGLDRQDQSLPGTSAQQRGQDRLRLLTPISPVSKGRAARARSALLKLRRRPDQQRHLGDLPSRPTTITTRRPAPPVQARSPPAVDRHSVRHRRHDRPGQHRRRPLRPSSSGRIR